MAPSVMEICVVFLPDERDILSSAAMTLWQL